MEQKIRIFLLCALLFMLVAFDAADNTKALGSGKAVRVAILKDAPKLTLSVKGSYEIVDTLSGKAFSDGKTLRDVKVIYANKSFVVGSNLFSFSHLKIHPQKDGVVYANGRRFRGDIDLIGNDNQSITVVNTVDLDGYIKGVMYHEVSHHWPMESLKVQAICARTYALYQMQLNRSKDYDVTSDIYSQVYGGKTSERYRTNLAVERTEGLILTYQGNILPAYYHATCAGHTEDVGELWNGDLPPLKGVECNFCVRSPHYNWKKNMRLSDIQEALNQKGYSIGLIKEIVVRGRNKSGRIRTLEIITRDDKKIIVSGKDFRDIIGPNLIRSNNYEIVMQGYYVDFIGKGWGHGVGMCQWGASEMARENYSYDEILKFYYPGAQIVNYDSFVPKNKQ